MSVLLDSREVAHPAYPDAVVRTPMLLKLDAANEGTYDSEWFGPISFVVATDSTAQSLEIFRRIVGEKGALTAAVYSTDEAVLDAMEDAALDVGVHLSCNLTGGVFVNQSAAFSDFHAQRRQRGGQLGTHRRGVRREPVPDRAVPASRIGGQR